ncbi:MAG: hypothetical protein M3295_09180, partial [Chloroflexota bacterium]|nr:hypothetical protein [Chloroflexota bacterium]
VRRGVPHWTTLAAPVDAGPVVELVADLRGDATAPPYRAIRAACAARGWDVVGDVDALSPTDREAVDALLGWSLAFATRAAFVAAFDAARCRLADLRRPDAAVELMTVHAAKGREFPVVVIVGFEDERFPNRRAVVTAADPARAPEDERRLAYVAVTRATRQLVLAFHPERPSPFLAELGLPTARSSSRRC